MELLIRVTKSLIHSNWGFKYFPDHEVKICSKVSDSNNFVSQLPQFNWSKTSLRWHRTHVKSLKDKLLSKIAALKTHFFNDIFHLINDITLFKENNEKEKPADLNNKKDEVMLLKEKSQISWIRK